MTKEVSDRTFLIVKGDSYTLKKANNKGEIVSSITVTDANGDGLTRDDVVSAFGDTSKFTKQELQNNLFSNYQDRNATGAKEIRADYAKEGSKVKFGTQKDFSLGSLYDISTEKRMNQMQMQQPQMQYGVPSPQQIYQYAQQPFYPQVPQAPQAQYPVNPFVYGYPQQGMTNSDVSAMNQLLNPARCYPNGSEAQFTSAASDAAWNSIHPGGIFCPPAADAGAAVNLAFAVENHFRGLFGLSNPYQSMMTGYYQQPQAGYQYQQVPVQQQTNTTSDTQSTTNTTTD
ncbi:hypothetical protein KBA27_02530, partial [bacterium]|nr:hypothetical protein [bacterium]